MNLKRKKVLYNMYFMIHQSEAMLRIKNCFIGVSVPIHLHHQLCCRNKTASGRFRA